MKITGTHTLSLPREQVWEGLHDPAVLARTLPGCQTLVVTGDDSYDATVRAGVASIKGTYQGSVQLLDKQPPERYVLRARGHGAPGTVDATAHVALRDAPDGGTVIEYEADAVVGGPIGGVGQRVIEGVAKKTAGEFFSAVERELSAAAAPSEAPPVGAPAAPREPVAAPAVGQVFGPARTPTDWRAVLAAATAGGLLALLGVVVGRWTARREG